MTAEVIQLREQRYIMLCTECNCDSWRMFTNDTVECMHCGSMVPYKIPYGKELKEVVEKVTEVRSISSLCVSNVLLKKKFIDKFHPENEDMAAIIHKDGSVNTYGEAVEGKCQEDWLKRSLKDIYNVFTGKPLDKINA